MSTKSLTLWQKFGLSDICLSLGCSLYKQNESLTQAQKVQVGQLAIVRSLINYNISKWKGPVVSAGLGVLNLPPSVLRIVTKKFKTSRLDRLKIDS